MDRSSMVEILSAPVSNPQDNGNLTLQSFQINSKGQKNAVDSHSFPTPALLHLLLSNVFAWVIVIAILPSFVVFMTLEHV
jgi:hypothetical protein